MCVFRKFTGQSAGLQTGEFSSLIDLVDGMIHQVPLQIAEHRPPGPEADFTISLYQP